MEKRAGAVVVGLIVLAIVAGVATYALSGGSNSTNSMNDSTANEDGSAQNADSDNTKDNTASDEKVAEGSTVVTFTDDGFEKQEYTVKAGKSLVIKNESSQPMQFSSDDHPTHMLNGELNATEISPGETTKLTPLTPGTYGIHDHVRSQFTTVVEVVG